MKETKIFDFYAQQTPSIASSLSQDNVNEQQPSLIQAAIQYEKMVYYFMSKINDIVICF